MTRDPLREFGDQEDLVIGRLADGTLTIVIHAEICDEGCGERVRYDVLHQTAACGCTVEGPEACNVTTRPMVIGRLRDALALVTGEPSDPDAHVAHRECIIARREVGSRVRFDDVDFENMRIAFENCTAALGALLPTQRERVIAAVAVLFGIDLSVEDQ